MAGKLRLDLPLDAELKRIFQSSVENIYSEFIQLVSSARGMTVDNVQEIARGRVWNGNQAADRGLVDRVGSLQDALDAAARRVGLTEGYRVVYIEPKLSALERFVLDLSSSALKLINLEPGQSPLLQQPLMQALLSDLRLLLRSDGQLTIAAHCMCSVR